MRFAKLIFSKLFICIVIIAALIAAIIFLCFYIHSLLPAAAAVATAYVLSFIAALCLLLSDSPADFKYGWLTLIAALPVAGAVLYFLSCFSRAQNGREANFYPPAVCASYEYFADGAAYLDRLITLVSAAKKQVLLEYYIISKGNIWGAIYRELNKALARGVKVMIIYDGLGSALRAPRRDFKALKKSGAEIKVFNSIKPLPLTRLNFRDHRKIAVIDDGAVFLGGVNIADEYANLSFPHGYWKDGGALFFGDIARTYAEIFFDLFEKRTSEGSDCPRTMPELNEFERVNGGTAVIPIADKPECAGSLCEDMLAREINKATSRVYILTPYLCAGDKLGDALKFAARRGVDVKIIIPHIPDKKLTYAITRSYCESFASHGIEVYTYTPGFMHHKAVICDDATLLGSYNFDFRSMRLNYECGIWCGENITLDAVRDFNSCLDVSAPFRSKKPRAPVKLYRALLTLLAPLV